MIATPETAHIDDEATLFPMPPESDPWTGDVACLHTAERLKVRDPEKYAAVLDGIRSTGNVTNTAKAYHVSVNTVYAIVNSEMGGMDKLREQLKGKMLMGVHLGVERCIELMPECKNPVQAAMVAGILADKHAMVAGAPGLIVEHRIVQATEIENFKEMYARMMERPAAGRVVEEAPAMLPEGDGPARINQPIAEAIAA
jgi:hypothetical protein